MNITRDERLLATLDHDDNGHTFHIITRTAAKGEDAVRMLERAANGDTLKDWGSHVNLKQAFVFAGSRGFSRQVCTNCDQWRTPDCVNECAKRGLTEY